MPRANKPREAAIALEAERIAKGMAIACVRNTFLEKLHDGKIIDTVTGDYSDVTVVTPTRTISWNEVSRISDEEMAKLNRQVLNALYTVLIRFEEPGFHDALIALGVNSTANWDKPELLKKFVLRTLSDEELESYTPPSFPIG